MAIPTMFGASLLKLVKFFAHGGSLAGLRAVLAVGVIVSFVVAYFVDSFLVGLHQENDFKASVGTELSWGYL